MLDLVAGHHVGHFISSVVVCDTTDARIDISYSFDTWYWPMSEFHFETTKLQQKLTFDLTAELK